MSFISNLFGGASSGQNFQAQNPFSTEQQQQAIKDAHAALAQQNALVQALQAQGGLQNQSNVFNQMGATAQDLSNAAQGLGPNPAQAQLAQATAANTANQAALMAGQRGASANAGLLARQAGMQGAANQQAAAGQAATMGAQQQLAARQQLQQQQAMMGNIAGQQAQQLQAGTMGAGQLAGQNQQAMLGAVQGANQANAQIAAGNAQRQGGAIGGLLGAAGTALAGPIGGALGSLFKPGPKAGSDADFAAEFDKRQAAGFKPFAHGGEVESAPHETTVRPDAGWGKVIVKDYANGGAVSGPKSHHGKYLNMQSGGGVPGHASVSGDSFKNDTQPAMLSPGEIVIPRHITQGPNAPEKAAQFVAAIMAKHGARK